MSNLERRIFKNIEWGSVENGTENYKVKSWQKKPWDFNTYIEQLKKKIEWLENKKVSEWLNVEEEEQLMWLRIWLEEDLLKESRL